MRTHGSNPTSISEPHLHLFVGVPVRKRQIAQARGHSNYRNFLRPQLKLGPAIRLKAIVQRIVFNTTVLNLGLSMHVTGSTPTHCII